MNKGTAVVGFFLCFLAGMGLMWGLDRAGGTEKLTKEAAGAVDHSDAPIPVTAKDPIWGNPSAPVTIVEISDFECPFCSRVGPTLKQVKETYGPDKVRIVWKNNPLPFHKAAPAAHEAAMAVFEVGGNDAFWKFHELAFQNQKDLTPANFETWAKQSGVDVAKFKAVLAKGTAKAKVDEDMKMSQSIGARGTPNFRINGVEVSGAQPVSKFKEVIDKELSEAQRIMAAGTAASKVYLERVKTNFGEAKKAEPTKDEKPQEPAEDTTIWRASVMKDDPFKGPADALVTLVVFSEFQCPFCKRVEPTLKKLVEEYKTDLRIVWKDNTLPFHQRAKPAATLARMAYEKKGNAGFWQAHDALFDKQPALEDADLEAVAKQVGLDWGQVKAAIESDKYKSKIQESMDMATDLKARGTPHFFANGFRIQGAQPYEKFKEVIDKRLAEAKAIVARGVAKSAVYDEIMKEAKGAEPPEEKVVPAPGVESPSKGTPGAKVVVQLWSDFQCPFCSRVNPTMKQIEEEYKGKVKIVWRDLPLPFHEDAPLAAQAAREAFEQKGSAGFWKFHDALFESQKSEGGIKRPNLEKIAQEQGLDMTKFKAALDSGKHKAKVEADAKIASDAGIQGTPATVVGKYFVSGAQPYGAFKKAIELALKDAR
jgi:protein-disulfide isomerase